jgi:hypothetical protein
MCACKSLRLLGARFTIAYGQLEHTASSGVSNTVEVELRRGGWKRTVLATVQRNAPNDAHVVLVHSDGRKVSAAGLLNEALCRAALKAVE